MTHTQLTPAHLKKCSLTPEVLKLKKLSKLNAKILKYQYYRFLSCNRLNIYGYLPIGRFIMHFDKLNSLISYKHFLKFDLSYTDGLPF